MWDCDVTVVRTAFDADSVEITDASNATALLYTVTVNKQMDGFSTSGVQASPTADEDKETNKTEASISVTPPPRAQASSMPFSGYFSVSCLDAFN